MQRILIADDHGLYREGLATLIRDSVDVEEVLEAASLQSAMEALGDASIGCLLIDIDMPGMDGVTSLLTIREQRADLRIVVVSGSDQRDDVLGALANGAHGYVWKGSNNEEIARALAAVMQGTIYVPSFLAGASEREAKDENNGPSIDLSRFTPRQADVLTLLAKGQSNKEIARELDLAESTVKIHVAAIFRELGARNRTQAVVLAQKLAFER